MNHTIMNNIPDTAQIRCGNEILNGIDIKVRISAISSVLNETKVKCLAIYLDNGADWLLVSMAAIACKITIIPLPIFFSAQQIAHILNVTQADGIIGNDAATLLSLMPNRPTCHRNIYQDLNIVFTDMGPIHLKQFRGILTFTSGSTGSPKGVLLPFENVYKQFAALNAHVSPKNVINYLTITPLSILLENIIAVNTLIHGGNVCVNSVSTLLDLNSFSLKVPEMIEYISREKINTLLLMPLFLEQLIQYLNDSKTKLPSSVDFIAVGGAMTPRYVLERADQLGLPVYQGYGLSESCSIVSMNTPDNNQLGSVGKVLPHVSVNISDEGNILVKGNLFKSYLGEAPINPDEFYDTGDLGYIKDGYLYITGRKKNIMVLQSGRNISPEWIEQEVLNVSKVNHVVVVADAKPYISVIVDADQSFIQAEFESQLKLINAHLPGFAQIKKFIVADEPFTRANQLLTMKHRPNQHAVIQKYQPQIDLVYSKPLG